MTAAPWVRARIEEATVNYGNRNNWREHAACAGADPELFEERALRGPLKHLPTEIVDVVEDFCRTCPVLSDCRSDAEESGLPLVGIFGGVYRTISYHRDLASGRRSWDILHPDFDPNVDIRRDFT